MSSKRKNNSLVISQLSRREILPLIVCAICLVPLGVSGQNRQSASGSANPPTATKSCEGIPPQQTSSHQQDGNLATDRLKLSTTAGQASSEPQGEFCRRDRSDQNSLRPSASSDQPSAAPESSTPISHPPIAKLTNGKLTITANGQDFASVLESVRSATGVKVEMPSQAKPDPVYLNVGPANVHDALVALLDGTNYNYIIIGSEKNSQVVKRLILTERNSGNAEALVATARPALVAPQASLYGGVTADADAEVSQTPPPPPLPIHPATTYSSIPTGINIQKLAAESGKTPGQILDELQKQQEQVLDDEAASQAQSAPQQ